jgi:uncharacterized protein
MVLEGTVSNVAQFGAFVDLGVHQDGLVHVSQLANRFVNDAREVVKTGDIVKVKVLEVDVARKRISLTMKLTPEWGRARRAATARATTASRASIAAAARPANPQLNGAMAGAFAKLTQTAQVAMAQALRIHAAHPRARRHIEQHGLGRRTSAWSPALPAGRRD